MNFYGLTDYSHLLNFDDDRNSSKRLIQLAAEEKFGRTFDVIGS